MTWVATYQCPWSIHGSWQGCSPVSLVKRRVISSPWADFPRLSWDLNRQPFVRALFPVSNRLLPPPGASCDHAATEKVTWWRPESHENPDSLFNLIIRKSIIHTVLLTRTTAEQQQQHSLTHVPPPVFALREIVSLLKWWSHKLLTCCSLCSLFCLVASKIRYLQEYHNRVQHNIYPVPSGTDIANTLKYFSQTLLR